MSRDAASKRLRIDQLISSMMSYEEIMREIAKIPKEVRKQMLDLAPYILDSDHVTGDPTGSSIENAG